MMFLTAQICGGICLVLLVYCGIKIARHNRIARLQREIDQCREEIQFLEQELDLAVKIAERLKDDLAIRFASVYRPQLDNEHAPFTDARNESPHAQKPHPLPHCSIAQNGKIYHYEYGELVNIE